MIYDQIWIVFSFDYSRVDDKLRVQITDNGLSRDLFPGDYHCLGDNENRPIKWLSFESITAKTFSTSSDVVSFFFGRKISLHALH